MKEMKAEKIRDWCVLIFYTLFIYISLPFMPRLWANFRRYAGGFTDYFAAFILGLIAILIISYLIATRKDIRSFIWLAILIFVYGFALSRLELPVERVHFIEYGILSFMVFRALRHDIKGINIYLWSAIIVFCLGFIDEGIQYILPSRVYDTRDVVVNGIAGILGLLTVGLCLQPKLGNSQ